MAAVCFQHCVSTKGMGNRQLTTLLSLPGAMPPGLPRLGARLSVHPVQCTWPDVDRTHRGGPNRGLQPRRQTPGQCIDNGTVKLWDTASRREVCTIKPGTGSGRVGALAFSPDGKRLATAAPSDPARIPPSWTNTEVKLWDTATGEELEPSRADQSESPAWHLVPTANSLPASAMFCWANLLLRPRSADLAPLAVVSRHQGKRSSEYGTRPVGRRSGPSRCLPS